MLAGRINRLEVFNYNIILLKEGGRKRSMIEKRSWLCTVLDNYIYNITLSFTSYCLSYGWELYDYITARWAYECSPGMEELRINVTWIGWEESFGLNNCYLGLCWLGGWCFTGLLIDAFRPNLLSFFMILLLYSSYFMRSFSQTYPSYSAWFYLIHLIDPYTPDYP